uniref:TLC domain-containing protein n=1 Tax=Chromera velia CCMP2878 TaxID=1169474 RepID=A0A0G4HFR8_9ALVE|eukprot:Cvel_26978.t1-p1 / transcript=Cvel_26978.t1 / gene=Cvel_26978 / organism=Chromera_velia_CCMP2878 / gene_product=Uncharacterized TLC domain-containing protein, putative / transcript_product=Uncharacterized TLC domain-containing protein, putative / location=Cvel_scaffold3293:4336-5624(+) / protein_length=275 / sequence_SO=supercontig / SO=protein_coding / is_pseudo=false
MIADALRAVHAVYEKHYDYGYDQYMIMYRSVQWTAFFWVCYLVSFGLFWPYYGATAKRVKSGKVKRFREHDWAARGASTVFACLVTVPGFYALFLDQAIMEEPLRSRPPVYNLLSAMSIGYFLWDIVISILFEPMEFIIHALMAGSTFMVTGYSEAFPMTWMGGAVLMFELSTVPLNLRWFLIAAGKTEGPVFQTVQMTFVILYALARIAWGDILVFPWVWYQLVYTTPDMETAFKAFIWVTSTTAAALNTWWFYVMVRKALKPSSRKELDTKAD